MFYQYVRYGRHKAAGRIHISKLAIQTAYVTIGSTAFLVVSWSTKAVYLHLSPGLGQSSSYWHVKDTLG